MTVGEKEAVKLVKAAEREAVKVLALEKEARSKSYRKKRVKKSTQDAINAAKDANSAKVTLIHLLVILTDKPYTNHTQIIHKPYTNHTQS